MSGIILQGKAIKVVNKGGGCKCTTENIGGGKRQIVMGPKTKGTDYVVFNCPGCNARNKRSVYDCKGRAGNSLSFKCNRCLREIEVSAPTTTNIILDPNSSAQSSGLVGPNGGPI
jgi:hypothetical protein